MTLYDLHTYQPSGLRQEDQDQVFNTCMAKTTALLGWTDNQTLLASFYPVLSAACVNVTKVAALLYDRGQPLDIDRISPPGLAVPLYGVISPILIVLSLVLNGGLVLMLVRQRMRTATAVFLGGMAVLDSLTGGLQLPFLVYGYVFDGHESYPNMAWCRVYWYVSKLLPTVTHTASLWLAAMLALQRHLGVSRSRTTKHACVKCTAKFTNVLCSVKGAMVVLFICSITAGILHALQAAFFTLKPVKVLSKEVLTSHGLDVIDTCSLRLKDQSLEVAHNYVYTWLRLLLAEFLPCFLIGRFNYSLVRLTRSSARYRRSLVHGHRESEKQESRSARRTTVMLVTVTSTALLTEVIVVVILLVEFLHVATSRSLIQQELVNHLGVVSNFLITVTLPANFLIYSYMGGHVNRLLKAAAACTHFCKKAGENTGERAGRDGEGDTETESRGGMRGSYRRRESGSDIGRQGGNGRREGGSNIDRGIDLSTRFAEGTGSGGRQRERGGQDTAADRDSENERSRRPSVFTVESYGASGERDEEGLDEEYEWRDSRRRPSVFVVESFGRSDHQWSPSYYGEGSETDDNCSQSTVEVVVTV